MDLQQLRQILDLVREHELSEFEIEHEGLRLKIRKDSTHPIVSMAPQMAAPAAAGHPVAPTAPVQAPAPSAAAAAEEPVDLAVVKSPIVGTFYRSSEPGAAPLVDIGSMVKTGQVLCIIEAMKLMNEIDSECDGEITNIFIENGQSVQYGERLFAIRTK